MTMFALTWIGLICWCVCFWWMHRISARQDALLKELHEITTRIEHLSQAEHDLISDVHPKVYEIKENVENVAEAVSPQNSANDDASSRKMAERRSASSFEQDPPLEIIPL